MKVSIIIPVYNQLKLTIKCLSDVLNTCDIDFETIVVDDCSAKEPISKILPKLFPNIKLITNATNLGFAKSINAGIENSAGEFLCFLNNDTELPNPRWLKILVDAMQDYDITGPAGGRLNKNYDYLPGEAKKRGEDFQFISFWCSMLKREVIEKIGPLPLNFQLGYWEDVYFCHMAKEAGFKMGITEGTEVKHLYHQTFKAEGFNLQEEYNKNRKIFLGLIGKENKK